jgi:hypothetical protein
MAHLARIASEVGYATGFPNENILLQKTLSRCGSGVLAGRCALYPPHSTPLLPPDGIVSTELVNSRIVGHSEVETYQAAEIPQ